MRAHHVLFELYETKPLRDELRSRLTQTMTEWLGEYQHAMARAAKSLRASQTRNLKKHFGSFDAKNDAKIEKMYKTYRKKQEDAIFTWSFNRLADYISNAIEPPIRRLSVQEMPVRINFVGRTSSTRASMTGSTLTIHLKWDDWKAILEGNKSLEEVIHALVSDIVHEMVHYNQIVINYKHDNDIFDRGLATSRKYNRKFRKSLEKAKKIGGRFEIKDVAYFTSNHEIEAYAASIASEVVDKANEMGITPRDFLKNHMMDFRDFRNFKFVSQEHPKVMKKLLRKIVQYVDHYTNDLTEDASFVSSVNNNNEDLISYFKTRPVPMEYDTHYAEYWETFCTDYLNEANQNAMVKKFGESIEDISKSCMFYYELPEQGMAMFADYLVESNGVAFIMHDLGAFDCPAWMLLSPEQDHLLPASTWLIHFSDHAAAIKQHGFIYGVPDIDKIALTFEHNPFSTTGVRREYKKPGYNFAYQIGKMSPQSRVGGYGKHAILFRGTGLPVWHNGDREEQVVFWGPAADTSNGIVIEATDKGWVTDAGPKGKKIDPLINRLLKRF